MCGGRFVFQQVVQGVKTEIPATGKLSDPILRGFEGLRAEADEVDAAFASAIDEAGAFEDAEVAGDGGEGDAERFREGGDGALWLAGEGEEDAAAGGVGEGGEDRGDAASVEVALIVNRHVKYIERAWRDCQGIVNLRVKHLSAGGLRWLAYEILTGRL